MKLRVQTLTVLLMIAVILLAGCNGDKQKPPEQVEITLSEKAQVETVPSTLYPSENPYQDLTVTGTAPISDYVGGINGDFLWIPEFEYEWEIEEMPQKTLPVAPNHAEKFARYEKREKELWDKFKKSMEGVTSEKVIDDRYREHQIELKNLKAEIMTEGIAPLNAAKYLMAHNIRTEHINQYAQQAVDENPDDFHTQLIWTFAQYSSSDDPIENIAKVKEGYRRLLEIRPNSAYALYNLGRLTHSTDAIPFMKKAYQYAPDVPTDHPASLKSSILFSLAQKYYYETREDTKAMETLQHMSKYNPESAEKWIIMMKTENRLGIAVRYPKENTNENPY
ncbi:MAG: hypothetical protein OXI67_15740 [Candidatus Poribacteria bacterium]|nr:hypothetical protein [Candidatus Poribacteria bacterium]